jgi:hypothetical protein
MDEIRTCSGCWDVRRLSQLGEILDHVRLPSILQRNSLDRSGAQDIPSAHRHITCQCYRFPCCEPSINSGPQL